MKIPLITKLLQRWARHRLRCILRGYRFLKTSDQLDKIAAVKLILTNTRISQCENRVSRLIFGAGFENAELIIRQYLLVRIGGLNLNKALLYSLGKANTKIIHPLPLEWRNVLRQSGFDVAEYWSAVFFSTYIFLCLVYGVILGLKQCFWSIKEILNPKFVTFGRFVYFDSLTAHNLPHLNNDECSYDIMSWYQQWQGTAGEIDTLCHNAKGVGSFSAKGMLVVSIRSPILPLSTVKELFQFVSWGIAASALATINLVHGRWWHALLLNQAVLASQFRMQNPQQIAKDYLFPNANYIYRPLWTYEAERFHARIIFYFYSSNVESFKQLDGSQPFMYGWQAMSWPYYLAWDKYQADFVRRAVGSRANVSVVGPIWFHTSKVEINKLASNAVAVFDVQPVRDSFYCTLGLNCEYYIPRISLQFLLDIYESLSKHDGLLALKRKRHIGKLVHPKYEQFINKIDHSSNFISINPDISAFQLIKDCVAVISMPFTSTALIAKKLGKPSIYYDPYGLVQKDDRAAHGIEIIHGPDELNTWLAAINHSKMKHETFC